MFKYYLELAYLEAAPVISNKKYPLLDNDRIKWICEKAYVDPTPVQIEKVNQRRAIIVLNKNKGFYVFAYSKETPIHISLINALYEEGIIKEKSYPYSGHFSINNGEYFAVDTFKSGNKYELTLSESVIEGQDWTDAPVKKLFEVFGKVKDFNEFKTEKDGGDYINDVKTAGKFEIVKLDNNWYNVFYIP